MASRLNTRFCAATIDAKYSGFDALPEDPGAGDAVRVKTRSLEQLERMRQVGRQRGAILRLRPDRLAQWDGVAAGEVDRQIVRDAFGRKVETRGQTPARGIQPVARQLRIEPGDAAHDITLIARRWNDLDPSGHAVAFDHIAKAVPKSCLGCDPAADGRRWSRARGGAHPPSAGDRRESTDSCQSINSAIGTCFIGIPTSRFTYAAPFRQPAGNTLCATLGIAPGYLPANTLTTYRSATPCSLGP